MREEQEIIDAMYEKLEKIRSEKGLSMIKFSEPLGKARNWYQQSLQSKRDIGYADLVRLLEYYEVEL
ncbi:MAG: helix-turn-helix transcriptional regulator [Leptospirales bacterium]